VCVCDKEWKISAKATFPAPSSSRSLLAAACGPVRRAGRQSAEERGEEIYLSMIWHAQEGAQEEAQEEAQEAGHKKRHKEPGRRDVKGGGGGRNGGARVCCVCKGVEVTRRGRDCVGTSTSRRQTRGASGRPLCADCARLAWGLRMGAFLRAWRRGNGIK